MMCRIAVADMLIAKLFSYVGSMADGTDLCERTYEESHVGRKYRWDLEGASVAALTQGPENVVTDVFIECPYGGPVIPVFEHLYVKHIRVFGAPVDTWRGGSALFGCRFEDSTFAWVLVFSPGCWKWRATSAG